MNTCGTCKYFGDNDERIDEICKDNRIACVRPSSAEFKPCLRYFADAATARAQPMDYSGYFAAICVKDDYGCVDWEAK